MPIQVLCSGCSVKLAVPDGAAGKHVRCPKCRAAVAVPEPAPEGPKFEVVEPERPPAPVRKRARDEDDGDDAPMALEREEEKADRPRPRRRREYDDDDDEEPRRKPPRRSLKRPRRRRGGSNPLASLGSVGTLVAVVGGVWLLGLLLGLVVPAAFLLPVVLGYLVALAGGIWFLIIAFSDNVMQGLLCLFVPFYSLLYLISNWETCKGAFLTQLGGWLMIVVTAGAAGVR